MNSDDSETTKIETLGIPKGWRWMPGMWTVNPSWVVVTPHDAAHVAAKEMLPDWTHPGTLGCALALARELWGEPGLVVDYSHHEGHRGWFCMPKDSRPNHRLARHHLTEGEALFAAIEAAPEQVETPKERSLDDELREDAERCKVAALTRLGVLSLRIVVARDDIADGNPRSGALMVATTLAVQDIQRHALALARLEGAEMQRDRAPATLDAGERPGRVSLSDASPQEAVRRVYTAGLETLSASERPDLRGFQMETANLPEHITTTAGGFTEWRSHWVRRLTMTHVLGAGHLELTVKLRRLDGGLEHVIESVTLEECEP